MKYKTMFVVEANEIEKAVKLQFGVDIEIRSLMWPEDCLNDCCCKILYFGEDMIKHNQKYMAIEETNNVYKERALVYAVMKNCFPEEEAILVDVSW